MTNIECSDPNCQSPNLKNNRLCQKCSTPLAKRYLWAIGSAIEYHPGDILGGRYLVISEQILLDTKPAQTPDTLEEIPTNILPYLRLSPYKLHIPQVYGIVPQSSGRHSREIWLLEQVPIYNNTLDNSVEPGDFMPELVNQWQNAPILRQWHWLWQIANLWEPLHNYHQVSSLLDWQLLRVEGSLVRLLQLKSDQSHAPTLADLGKFWAELVRDSPREIQQVCQQLINGQIKTSEQLITILDQQMAKHGRSQSRLTNIVTFTDKGPSRRRNEDSCYPATGVTVAAPLAIVCDGIGGHEGGDVASNLAINTIVEQLNSLNQNESNPSTIQSQLSTAICAANDRISQRNDGEQRQAQQRMGTTVVMTLTQGHQIYISHVGDSRVYRITRTGCYQVTLDDDIASREVRLGYAIYRDAVEQRTAGALVQALGMSSSSTLHPTLQRFILDEDCIFLLCSDGLSDNDRVEQYWETKILPVLDGSLDLLTAGQSLIELANTQNGHDNVTVALVYCQVKDDPGATKLSTGQQTILQSPPTVTSHPTIIQSSNPQSSKPTSLSILTWWRSPVVAAGLVGLFVFLTLGAGALAFKYITANSSTQTPKSTPTTSATNSPVDNSFPTGTHIKIKTKIDLYTKISGNSSRKFLIIPEKSVWQIQRIQKQATSTNNIVKLKACQGEAIEELDLVNPTGKNKKKEFLISEDQFTKLVINAVKDSESEPNNCKANITPPASPKSTLAPTKETIWELYNPSEPQTNGNSSK